MKEEERKRRKKREGRKEKEEKIGKKYIQIMFHLDSFPIPKDYNQ